MVVEKSLQTYGGTQGDISPALARDIRNGPQSNHIFPLSPGLGQIEASFLNGSRGSGSASVVCSLIHIYV